MDRLSAYRRITAESVPWFSVTCPGRADRMETAWPKLVKAFWAQAVPTSCEAGIVRKARVRLVKRGRR